MSAMEEEYFNIYQMAFKINSLTKEVIDQAGKNCKLVLENEFTDKVMANNYLKLYKSLI